MKTSHGREIGANPGEASGLPFRRREGPGRWGTVTSRSAFIPRTPRGESVAAGFPGCFFLFLFLVLVSNVDIALFFPKTAEQQDGWKHGPVGPWL